MGSKLTFERGRGLFVTGTNTGVGKTVVAGAIAKCLADGGQQVGVFKPIATGCKRRREGLVSGDAEFLAHCSDSLCPLEQINPIRYQEPLAPSVAAERAEDPIDWDALQLAYRNVVESSDLVVVEGIGGVMVPISNDYMVLDLMADMQLPVVIVASAELGTINHTLLTLKVCRERGLTVAGVVINSYQADGASVAEETNPRVIAEIAKVTILTVIPWDKNTCLEKGQLGSDARAAAGQVNWAGLCGGRK